MTDEELRLLSRKLAQQRNLEKRREDILRLLAGRMRSHRK